MDMLKNEHPDVQSVATFTLAKLAEYGECLPDIVAASLTQD
jgi:hypothetical protein